MHLFPEFQPPDNIKIWQWTLDTGTKQELETYILDTGYLTLELNMSRKWMLILDTGYWIRYIRNWTGHFSNKISLFTVCIYNCPISWSRKCTDVYTGKYSWTQGNLWILKQDFLSLFCDTCNSISWELNYKKLILKYSLMFFLHIFDNFLFIS